MTNTPEVRLTGLEPQFQELFEAIRADYRSWSYISNPQVAAIISAVRSADVRERMYQAFAASLTLSVGSKYIRIISDHHDQRSVWGFVVRETGGKFKRGDILKAAGWKTPALNAARGNIFGEYVAPWTGAAYLG
jgi:hypothetical protein